MQKKGIKILLGLILSCSLLVILYLFNTEKVHSEFWLQKKINTYSCIEPPLNTDLTGESLTYNFYDDSGIDIEISLYNKGYITLSLNKWFKDNSNPKTYTFKTDKDEIDNLINTFKSNYPKSEFKEIEDHLGGRYATLEYQGGKSIKIGFYNITPDKKFKSIKNKIVDLGNDVITLSE